MEQQSQATPEAVAVVTFLRNASNVKTRAGALAGSGKRLDYFKGSAAVKALLSPAYAKLVEKGVKNKTNVPRKITDEKEAEELLNFVIRYAFFLRVDRGEATGGKGSPKEVKVNQMQMFKQEFHYAWFFEGSQLALKAGGFLMIFCMLAGVMFPLWPPIMRLGVWYLSMGFLGLVGLFFVIAIFRLIFWVISLVVLRPGVWIFPNLFEDVGFVDSFIPLWAWDIPPPKKEKKRKAKAAAAAAGANAGAKQQAASILPGATPQPAGPAAPPAAIASAPTTASKQATVADEEDDDDDDAPAGHVGITPHDVTTASLDDMN